MPPLKVLLIIQSLSLVVMRKTSLFSDNFKKVTVVLSFAGMRALSIHGNAIGRD